MVPYLLEALGVPYTGCPADAIHLTSHKILAKRLLVQAGLPTPAWLERRTARRPAAPAATAGSSSRSGRTPPSAWTTPP